MQFLSGLEGSSFEEGPLYLRLQADIRQAVRDGRLKPLEALPPEREIAANLGVSRVTVRKALEGLVAEGLIQQRHGSGTFVAPQPHRIEEGLSHLTSFTEDMRARGNSTTSHWLERAVGAVTPEEAMHLTLSPGSRVARLARMRRSEALPIVVERSRVPVSIMPDPEIVEGSLYETLHNLGHRPVRALQRISAVNLGEADAALLEVPAAAAALSTLRVAFDVQGRPVVMTRALYRSDAYDFMAELVSEDAK